MDELASLMKTININGEQLSVHEAQSLIRMFCNDARKIAGEFHGMNRSVKFRRNWPDEYVFADANWKTFVEACRQIYAARLGDPHTPADEARQMHLAIVLWSMIEKTAEPDPRLQLAPDTQQFEGDRYENKKIVEQFGPQSNTFKRLLLGSASKSAVLDHELSKMIH